MKKREEAFRSASTDSSTRVLLIWGMKKQDLSCCNQMDADCFGCNSWDQTFTLNSVAAQRAFMVDV